MKELIKKQHEECRKAYESLKDKTSAAALQLLGAMGAYERLCSELIENEDKRTLVELTSLFEDGIKGVNHRYTGEDCGRWLAWLKKQSEQNTIEWSKEDIEHLNSICATLKGKANERPFDTPSYYDKQIEWLKSLRPQNRWKPTAAQMYALKQEVENKFYSGVDSDLSSLYQDLIKLL